MKKTIKYLQDGEYHYATVKDVGDLEQLKTQHKEDLVTALNELFTTGGSATPTGYDDLVKKVNDTQTTVDGINSTITDVNGKVVAHDEAIAQAKKDLQDALAQFQEFNDEIEQAKKDAETELANAKQALKDEFTDNLADAQKANQKQLEDKVSAIQGNLDTTSNTLNDVKTQLTNAKLDYGNVNTSIQKLNDMLATKLSSTDLDPLKTSIQNQETEIQQTKDSIATKAGKAEFDVLSGRVSTAESKIKQQADEISLGVKKSELNGAIDDYQVEGTNRLRDTIDFDIDNGYWKLDQYSINSNTDVHPYDQAHDVSALVLQKTGSAKQDVDFTNEDLGNSFVISVWNKKDAQPQVWYGNTQLTNRQVSDIKGDYERSFFTFIPTDVNVKTIMFKYDAGTVDQLVIGEPKLELGTKPKAYAPNPNDEHKQIVNTKAELKIASDKIESTVEKQTKTDDNINQLSSRVTQTEQGITATNDLITKTKDGLIKDYTGKIDASAKSLSSEFDEKTDEKIGQITDSGENLILNSAFTNETDRKDKWQNISDKVNIVDDGNGLMWAKMSQSGLTADNPISLTSNYFPIKQGKITVGVDIKTINPNELSDAKILVLQTYNANKQRVDFTELTLEDMGLAVQQLADGQSHRGVYRLGNDRSDAVYMTVKAVLPRNGSIYFTNFSAKLSSIDNGGYTPNAEDLKRQILNQKTKIEQNSQQITLKASSTELRDVRTIANGAVSSATNANNNASSAMNTANTANSNANQANSKITDMQTNGGGRNLLLGTRDFSGDWLYINDHWTKTGDTYDGLSVIETNGGWNGAAKFYPVKKGETYTFSLFARYTSGTGSSNLYVILNANPENGFVQAQCNPIYAECSLDTNWKKCSVTFTVLTDGYIKPRMERTDTNANTLQVCGYMLEKGTVAHEWQPAPEDIQSQIDQARTDIQSTLTVANNGITAATNLKTTYDNYVQKNDANIKLLGDRITNEVSKITSNGGGRNLWIDSKSFQHTITNAPQVDWNANSDGIRTAHITGTGGFYGQWQNIYANSTEPFAIGDSETFSVEMKGTGTITIGREWDFEKNITLTDTWTRYSVSGEVKAANRAHIMYNESGKDCDAYVRLPMVEKGVIAHEWQPAPQDVDAAISNVNTKVEQYKTGINQTATGMNLFAQVITGNSSIDVTKSNIGIDPNQIKIASNKIVIDGNTIINGDVISANNIKSGGTIEGVGLTIKNGDHVTTLDDRGFIDYKNNNKTVISDGTFMSNNVNLSGELQTSEKTLVNGVTQYQTVSVGHGYLDFNLYPFDPTPDIQINSSSSSSTNTSNTDNKDDITLTTIGTTAGQALTNSGGRISASYGLPNLQTGQNNMTGLDILGQNISLTARKVAASTDVGALDRSEIIINNNALKMGVLQNGGHGNTSVIDMDNYAIRLNTNWLNFSGNMTLNGDAEFNNEYYTMFKPTGNQDALYVVSQKNSNSTQNDYAQTTLRAGSKYGTYGDSGLTFYWNSVKAFGTFDLRDTHVLGNRNTHFSVETTFDTDGEANMCFTWTSRSDLWNNDKLPMLARADWWTSQWGSCGLGFANGRLFYFTNDGHTYKQLN